MRRPDDTHVRRRFCRRLDDGASASSVRTQLVIEVAESSLRYDLNAKALLYAEADVPEYFVVNLVDHELAVFRSPQDGAYRDRASYRSGDGVALATWPDVRIDVGTLFPARDLAN